KRQLFEYFAHAACYIPMPMYPLFRWRMDASREADWYGGASKQARNYIESVYRFVADNGPVAAGELPQAGKSSGNWWGWSDGKRAIETLFRLGRVAVSGRRNFARLYDLPERVIPREILEVSPPSPDDAKKELIVLAAKALGVGAASDIAGYFYIETWWDRPAVKGKRRRSQLKRLMAELVEERRLAPAAVQGWVEPGYIVPGTRVPRSIEASGLVSPFDPIMWNRIPTQRVFGFSYQIEIYVPEPKRRYGYYVLPFLLGDRFVARVDLKADRKQKALLVPGAFLEQRNDAKRVAAELAGELRRTAAWLGLERIEVGERGDLVRPLARALR
ncbi:MAG: winged helix-turn-helix domain-containing protein, partial [Actinomycetota bacterium]